MCSFFMLLVALSAVEIYLCVQPLVKKEPCLRIVQ